MGIADWSDEKLKLESEGDGGRVEAFAIEIVRLRGLLHSACSDRDDAKDERDALKSELEDMAEEKERQYARAEALASQVAALHECLREFRDHVFNGDTDAMGRSGVYDVLESTSKAAAEHDARLRQEIADECDRQMPEHDAAVRKVALLAASEIALAQSYFVGTDVGKRQEWVKCEIAEKIRNLAKESP